MRRNHLAFEIVLEHQTLWVRAFGVWTSRDVEDYVRVFRETVQPVIDNPWAVVLDVRQWQTSPAEIFNTARDNSKWSIEHRLACVIALVPTDSLVGWQFVQATSVEVPDYLIRQRVETDQQARESLIAAGFLLAGSLPDKHTGD